MDERYEEFAPLLRGSVPTSSLRNQEFDALLARDDGEASLPDEPLPARIPLHQQADVVLRQESSSSSSSSLDVSEILSLHWSQHDPRAEGRPTNALDIPRYIEYNVQEELNARLDAVEQGFKTLCQRLHKRYETSSSLRQVTAAASPKIAVERRYPQLQQYTPEEVTPLLDYDEQRQRVKDTRDYIRPIPKEEQPTTTTPKWRPRSLRTIQLQRQQELQAAASRSPNISANEGLYQSSNLDGLIRVEIKDDRISSNFAGEASESSKHRASQRLGEMLSSKRTPRQESQTTFATDQRVFGSLFTGKSSATTGTTTTNPAATKAKTPGESQFEATVEGSGDKERAEIQPERSDSFRQKDATMKQVLEDVRRDQQEAERERQGLQQLKQGGGDLSDSLKAFLREFHSTQQAPADSEKNEI